MYFGVYRKLRTLDIIKRWDGMDRISELPDALLLMILSLLPAKDVVKTMVLSKRWQFLWTLVPRLEYSDDMYQDGENGRFLRFVYSSLLLHEPPVLERLCLKLGRKSGAIDIRVCVRAAVNRRSVRELIIKIDDASTDTPVVLPRSLYTSYKMLTTLALNNAVLVDSSPTPVSFPLLKTLRLSSMKYPSDEFLCKLLSSFPVLEDLVVEQCPGDNVAILVVRVASLKYFSFNKPPSEDENYHGVVIDAPSLEYLDIVDYTDGFCIIERDMPYVAEANLDVTYYETKQLLGCLTSLEQLSLCLATSKDAYFEGTVFSWLVHLEICTCDTEWLYLLMRLLKDSPKLRFLQLEQLHDIETETLRPCWKEPSHVPECLLSSLETFVWKQYEGRVEEREVATYILRNSGRLEIARFYPKLTGPVENVQMLMELAMSPRSSSICQLKFHGNHNSVLVPSRRLIEV